MTFLSQAPTLTLACKIFNVTNSIFLHLCLSCETWRAKSFRSSNTLLSRLSTLSKTLSFEKKAASPFMNAVVNLKWMHSYGNDTRLDEQWTTMTIHCWQMITSISGVGRSVMDIPQPRQIWWLFVYSSSNKAAEMEQMLRTCTQRWRQTFALSAWLLLGGKRDQVANKAQFAN